MARCHATAARLFPAVEAVEQVGDRQRPGAGRGDLERQRQTVEPAAEFGHFRTLFRWDRHSRVTDAIEEQPDARRIERGGVAGVGERERGEGDDGPGRHIERRAAGGEHAGSVAGVEKGRNRGDDGIENVFAVVGDHQEGQIVAGEQGVERREPELSGEGSGNGVGLVDSRQVDEANPVRESVGDAPCRLPRGGRLADAPRACHGHQAPGAEPLADLRQFGVAADQQFDGGNRLRHDRRSTSLRRSGDPSVPGGDQYVIDGR